MSIARLKKVYEDPETLVINEIRLPANGSLKIKDKDGFTIAEFDESTGKLKIKGGVTKV